MFDFNTLKKYDEITLYHEYMGGFFIFKKKCVYKTVYTVLDPVNDDGIIFVQSSIGSRRSGTLEQLKDMIKQQAERFDIRRTVNTNGVAEIVIIYESD